MNGTDRGSTHRRLSRETRHLLIAALVALVALWGLARLRFPDRPATPNPIPPLLTQLSSRPGLSDLASEVGRVQNRLSGSLFVPAGAFTSPGSSGAVFQTLPPALRIRPDVALALLPRSVEAAAGPGPDLLAMDRATGLALIRTDTNPAAFLPAPWAPERLDVPRFFLAASVTLDRVALSPVFVAGLRPHPSPAWSGPIWVLPPNTDVTAGSMLFTADGEIVGAVTHHHGGTALIPGDTLLADAQRLLDRDRVTPGEIGVAAHALTPRLSAATGASTGVIVSWVDPNGPAAADVAVGDVVESLNGTALVSVDEWDVRSNRLAAGDGVVLEVRRRGSPRHVRLTAVAVGERARTRALGMNVRFVPGLGSEVLDVEPASAADAAGVRAGDLITAIDAARLPTPARIQSAYAAAGDGQSMLVAVTRGGRHHVLALDK